jgi:hypothetical protein
MIEGVNPYTRYFFVPDPHGSGSAPASLTDLEDFYGSEAIDVHEELGRLFANYRARVLYAQRHYAPSPTWREERLLHDVDHVRSRWAIRVHAFEATAARAAGVPPEIQDAGRYLGFVTLRPPGSAGGMVNPTATATTGTQRQGFRYVVEAELVPPRQMLRPRYHVLTTTVGAARLGVLPFRSAVFMPPHAERAPGSSCMHVAVSQALHLTMERFGARPVTQREFDAQLWGLDRTPPRTLANIQDEGASFQDTLAVLRKCQAEGFIETFTQPLSGGSGGDTDKLFAKAYRCLTDLLANGLPVIIAVNHPTLLDPKPGDVKPIPVHGTLITGMHLLHTPGETQMPDISSRVDDAELPGRFIGHDTLRGPFVEWCGPQLLRAALAAYPDTQKIEMLAIGPPGIRMTLGLARQFASMLTANWPVEDIEAYIHEFGKNLPEDRQRALATKNERENWRYVVRLTDFDDLRGRYFPKEDPASLAKRLAPGGVPAFWWCVEARVPELGGQKIPPVLVHFWAADDEPATDARGMCLWQPGGPLLVK